MKEKLAIVGTGIAGMGMAYFLKDRYDIKMFEKNNYVGGHTNTVFLPEGNEKVSLDTGFMVFNFKTYPQLCKLFERINAPIKKTDMSFSVQHLESKLEYSGSGIAGLFAQKKNLFNIKYIKMLMDINRFNSESVKDLENPEYSNLSIKEYINKKGFGEDMLWKFLIPMSSAVWSTPMELILDFPIKTLVQFFYNHGFLGLDTQHQWYTLEGGSESYKALLIKDFKEKIQLNSKVIGLTRKGSKVQLRLEDGLEEEFDKVVFASHADESLEILGKDASPLERNLLSPFKYQKNIATVHSDESIMPKNKKVWSSWNYRIDSKENKSHKWEGLPSTIYWMNSLQGVSDKKNYFVSINDPGKAAPEKVFKTIEYHHPLFDLPAVKAQDQLQALNNQGNNTYFCGSYFKYGFHEDAFASAVTCAAAVLNRDPWEQS